MKTVSENAADKGPLLGALLRLAHQSFIKEITSGLSEAGFSDLQPAHFSATQPLWDHPGGLRLNELANRARITKQSMGELVNQLVLRGYLERVTDPEDGRARLILLTALGLKATRLTRKLVHNVEKNWSQQIGNKRIEDLRATLKMLFEADTNT
jgi:DNA-binding MarR family transcriptional regulator